MTFDVFNRDGTNISYSAGYTRSKEERITMSDVFYKKLRQMVGLDGLLSLIFGLLVMFWPNRTAAVVTILVGIAFIAIGLSYVSSITNHDDESAWARLGSLLIGAIYLVAGVFIFINLYVATAYLFMIVGLLVGMTWVIEAIVTFASLKYYDRKGWAIFSGIISLIGGFVFLFAPIIGAAVLWSLLGLSLTILGVIKLIQYMTWSRR